MYVFFSAYVIHEVIDNIDRDCKIYIALHWMLFDETFFIQFCIRYLYCRYWVSDTATTKQRL